MIQDRVARAMVGLGCSMIVGVPLALVGSCAVSRSTEGSQPSVQAPTTPAVQTPAVSPQRSAQSPGRPVARPGQLRK
ncbi:hypothetical protein AB0M39_41130 [Streptomyces sp. NPDC051907]|uniref:hypothetical protein n=1 Tax=Streptomyces sp. NPDC051907 TaxID=3155284 RepID=UPI0034322DE6